MEKIILKIEGMHCNGCSTRLENVLNETEGVNNAKVSLEDKEAVIEFENITKEELESVIEDAGFKSLGE